MEINEEAFGSTQTRLCLNGVHIIDENHLGWGGGGVMLRFLNSTKENQYFILSYMFDPSGICFSFSAIAKMHQEVKNKKEVKPMFFLVFFVGALASR